MSDTVIENEEAEFSEDVFESMLNGSFEPEDVEEDEVEADEEDADIADDLDADNSEHQEDTDQKEDSEDEEELDEADDGELDEDSEDEDEDEEEDTLVEDYDSDDEDGDSEDEEDADTDEVDVEPEDEDTDEESEDEADTEEISDGEAQDTDGVDYKAFYDAVVNTEFTVNGRKSKGFSDPKKIIQSMQMAGGFSEKMAGFKKYKPFMSPLKERGMLDDPTKFDLAMNILDGDKEAIKQHLSTLKIDPMELDMDTIAYQATPATATQEAIVVDEALDRARNAGIEDKFRDAIGRQWDEESFNEFVKNPNVRNDLIQHMETGVYDTVQDKIAEMKRLDFNGVFSDMSTIAQYRAAVKELTPATPVIPVTETVKKVAPKVAPKKTVSASVKEEKAKIAKARKEAAYKKQVKANNAKIAEERRKATSVSKRKAASKAKAKFDPLKVEGSDLDALMEELIAGGR